jgi:hypothetical protein
MVLIHLFVRNPTYQLLVQRHLVKLQLRDACLGDAQHREEKASILHGGDDDGAQSP